MLFKTTIFGLFPKRSSDQFTAFFHPPPYFPALIVVRDIPKISLLLFLFSVHVVLTMLRQSLIITIIILHMASRTVQDAQVSSLTNVIDDLCRNMDSLNHRSKKLAGIQLKQRTKRRQVLIQIFYFFMRYLFFFPL